MAKLIGICGYSGHGKDTLADLFVKNCSFTKIAFAKRLKQIAYALNPIVKLDHVEWREYCRLQELVDDIGWDLAKRNNNDVRTFLQKLGTEAMRNLVSDNIWVDLHKQQANEEKFVVVPDVRFPNEAKYILESNGLLLAIHDPRKETKDSMYKHASETYVDVLSKEAHYQFVNSGTLADLETQFMNLMAVPSYKDWCLTPEE